MAAKIQTRRDTEIWLVGSRMPSLTGSKLPSKREILQVYFYLHLSEKRTVRESSSALSDMILAVWNTARIPCKLKKHLTPTVEKLVNKWHSLMKNKRNKKKRSKSIEDNEKRFADELDNLFDIAHPKALELIKVQEDRDFLIAQRQKGRPGTIGPIDKTTACREKKMLDRQEASSRRRVRELERKKAMTAISTLCFSSAEESFEVSDTDVDYTPPKQSEADHKPLTTPNQSEANSKPLTTPKKVKRARKTVVTPELAAALDRSKMSDRSATYVLAETTQSLGKEIDNFNINRSSIRRERLKQRKRSANAIKTEFTPDVPLIIHWDGKLLSDITGKEKVDRLPILVTGLNVDKLLGVPKLPRGTGAHMSNAIISQIEDWGLKEHISGECFDTTSSNTGIRVGACVLIEQKLGKNLLHFACRHHIHEIILEAVGTSCLGPSTGPEIALFKKFQTQWKSVDKTKYQPADDMPTPILTKQEVVEYAKLQLQRFQPRDDYKELLELCIIFVGGEPNRGFRFMAHGAMHRARWMAKAIYCIKMFLFRCQIKLTKQEKKGLFDVALFVAQIYLKAWFMSQTAISAPLQDLTLLKQLDSYKDVNPEISKVGVKKMLGHLWYVSEKLVMLALFDENVSLDTKRRMVQAVNDAGDVEESPHKCATVSMSEIQNQQLEDFASRNSLQFFNILKLQTDFLQKDPSEWQNDITFNRAYKIAANLRVVNDNAERGVALITEYNRLITCDEEQKQYLLQVVSKHRKQFPDCRKKTLKRKR